ncbi:MAG: hypothetical protein NVS2B7_21390 [Herpetosiphon sp.]
MAAQRPTATLREIEQALDTRLGQMRARLMADIALASAAADLTTTRPADRPRCPICGGLLQARGQQHRTLTTQGDQPVTLTSRTVPARPVRLGFFPWMRSWACAQTTPGREHDPLGNLDALSAWATELQLSSGVSVVETHMRWGPPTTWADSPLI